MPVQVIFTYDETKAKWSCQVINCDDKEEARNAFSAVVLTCQSIDKALLELTDISDDHSVTPYVWASRQENATSI